MPILTEKCAQWTCTLKCIFKRPIEPTTKGQRFVLAASFAIIFLLVQGYIFDPLHIPIVQKALLSGVFGWLFYLMFEYNLRLHRLEQQIHEITNKRSDDTAASKPDVNTDNLKPGGAQ